MGSFSSGRPFVCKVVLMMSCCISSLIAQKLTGSGVVPPSIKFNGTLREVDGSPHISQTVVALALYASQDAQSPLWTTSVVLTPDTDGKFTVVLGNDPSNPLPVDLFDGVVARWIGYSADGLQETRRQQIVSVPYSLRAGSAD